MEILPFQKLDFLDQETFDKLHDIKPKLLPYHFDMFLIPLSNKFDEKKLGAFAILGEKIRHYMIEHGYKNPKCNRIGVIRNNRKHVPWHTHPSLGNMNPVLRQEKGKHVIPLDQAYVSVFYCHKFDDPKYQGIMGLSKSETSQADYTFPAKPNSLIIHSAEYGHFADTEELDPTQDRLSCYIHWVTEP